MTTSWNDVDRHAPELAAHVRSRLEDHGLALVATLRRDGSPRISGIEPLIAGGELWLGMMPGSRKAADLERDPRFALHGATIDKEATDGDVKIAGRAIAVAADSAEETAFRRAFADATGSEPPPGPMSLFVADITEVSSLRVAGDHLDIEWWRPGDGLHATTRY